MKTVQTFFDKDTFTLTYLVYDETSKDAVLFDPVLNYEPNGSTFWFDSILEVESFIKQQNLKLHYIIDTHAHADHITGALELKKRFPSSRTIIGKEITQVQDVFKGLFNLDQLKTDASQFDILVQEDDEIKAGTIIIKPIHTPGHTPTCTSYLIDDIVFTGDALFMPDSGTGRCDFPKGSAKDLYHSIHEKLYKLKDETKVFVGHDYMPGGREVRCQTTIGESKTNNIHLKEDTTEEGFIAFRTQRDKTLTPPRLLLPSIQVNIDGGRFPKPENNHMSYLKIPLREKK